MVDIIIIGGGIVGLATAYQLLHARPGTSLLLLEKETALAQHQTGRNSGVLHAGIYYKPGSQKALASRAGKRMMEAFCEREGIAHALCGKVVVAVNEQEQQALHAIYERAQANGVTCRLLDRAQLAEIEPHTAGIAAIHVPETGIVDYTQVSNRLAQRITEQGGVIQTGVRVTDLVESQHAVTVVGEAGASAESAEFEARVVLNCAGLFSDRVARMAGVSRGPHIIPFRGDYFTLTSDAEHLCNGLIYPVPDPRFPFLGVHFTRMIHGGVECGPNAVLAFAREGYRNRDISARDVWEIVRFPGFRKLAARYWRTGLSEQWRSLNKRAFVTALQRLVPAIQADQLRPAPAGVRAQAIAVNGQLVDDFAFATTPRTVHVINAPSPAATASLEIGRIISTKLTARLD